MRKITAGFVGTGMFLAITTLCANSEMVFDGGRTTINLNGDWETCPINGLLFNYPPPIQGWQTEKVPHLNASRINTIGGAYGGQSESPFLNDEGTDYRQKEGLAAWFKREFDLPPEDITKKRRAKLYFHGMAFKSETWFNGKKIGTSYLGHVPIEYDVTDLIKPGAKNEVVVGLAGREALLDIKNKIFVAPVVGVSAGIWGKVELRLLPEVYIDDIFVKTTSVKKKYVEIEITVVNESKNKQQFLVDALITDKTGTPRCNMNGAEITLSPGEGKVVTLSKDWIAERLWSCETPEMYLIKASLKNGESLTDQKTERFGFREFEIKGRDFYLNGVRKTLLRYSTQIIPGSGGVRETRKLAGKPYNCVRLHKGFIAESVLDTADETGLMAMPEFAWHTSDEDKFYINKSALWLPNVLDYTRKIVKLHRNRPSVVIWSLTNESFWGGTGEPIRSIAEQIINAVKEVDPTRPQQGDAECSWDKTLPIINIHYPEACRVSNFTGIVGTLRQQYPNSVNLFPNDFSWLKKDGENIPWRAKFEWDRPLIIGEYWGIYGDPNALTCFMGEQIYDLEKWRLQDISGDPQDADWYQDGRFFSDNEYLTTLKMMNDVYRMAGVAGLNAWCGSAEGVLPQVAVSPVDFHPNFFGGRIGVRKVAIFNDGETYFPEMVLQCRLAIENRTAWQDTVRIDVPPGQFKVVEISIKFPAVSAQVKGDLSVRLASWHGGQLGRYQEEVFILPPENMDDVNIQEILLLDPTGQTAEAFTNLGLKVRPVTSLTAEALKNHRTLIIGEEINPATFKDIILSFAEKGGNVIILRQSEGIPLSTELPEIDTKHAATRSWKRYYNHPVTAGLEDQQFSYWRPDNLVATKTFSKPSTRKFKILLDCGGIDGLAWTPLVEIPYGKGVFLLSQLNLTDRIITEPVAGKLLAEMVRYCQGYRTEPALPLSVMSDGNDPLTKALEICSIVTKPGFSGGQPVLIDSGYSLSSEELLNVKEYLESGGKVWLHGFSPETISKVANLFPFEPELVLCEQTIPFKPELVPWNQTIQSAIRRSTDPLMNNLSSFDFFWTRTNVIFPGFDNGQPTAKLGRYVLNLPSWHSGEKLIEPGLLIKIPAGKGTILFDTLLWEDALGAEFDKVSRFITSIALNLGIDVRTKPEKEAYRYFHINLTKHANMGLYDEVADDGKGEGGWVDEKNKDIRFFVPVGEFPGVVSLADITFELIDLEKNEGRSVITLRGGKHVPTMPVEVLGIKVGKRTDKLWFLQTAAWSPEGIGQEVGKYIIHYEDGRQELFPLRNGMEIADGWNPRSLPGAKIAWSKLNNYRTLVGIYATEWKNPHPEKVITSIDLIGNLGQAPIVLLAITGGVKGETNTNIVPVSIWNFADFKDGILKNRIPGAPDLLSGEVPPELVQVSGKSALRFRNGQALGGTYTKDFPGLRSGEPFILDVLFAVEDKPAGYCGGIYQCMRYLESGFRLTLLQEPMSLLVEIFPSPGEDQKKVVFGKTVLVTDRFYKATVKFDGTRCYLFLDDKPEGFADTTAPSPTANGGDIAIGAAGGANYFFNGLISEVKLSAIK